MTVKTEAGDFAAMSATSLHSHSHMSATSLLAMRRELGLFFKAGEVLDFPRAGDRWVYDSSSGKSE